MSPASIRSLGSLFASPPGIRAAVARSLFAENVGVTACLATIVARDPAVLSPRTPTCSGSRVPRSYALQRKRLYSSTPPAAVPHPTSPEPPLPPPRSRARRFLTTTGLALVLFTAGFAMTAAPVAEAAKGLLDPVSDGETLDLFQPTTPTASEIDEHIRNHPLSRRLRAQEGVVESRPHMKIPAAMRAHNLTGGALMGEGKIEVPPLTFCEKESALPTLTQISYLGPALCGHPGIVHGGLLATLLDEGLARACFPALPNKVGVTASLKIDYRKPCPGSSYVVLKAETTKVEGRKAWVKGWIELLGEEDAEGTVLVEAEALFIEPKHAKSMARVVSGT